MALAHERAGADGGDLLEFDALGSQRPADHLLVEVGEEDDPQVGTVVVDVVDDRIHPGLLEGEVEAGVGGLPDEADEGVLGEGVALGGDGEMQGDRPVLGLVDVLDVLLLFQQGVGVAEELAALLGELHAAVVAVEKADAQLGLQILDGAADAGLAEEEVLGGLVDRAAAGDLDEVQELLKGHTRPPSAFGAEKPSKIPSIIGRMGGSVNPVI